MLKPRQFSFLPPAFFITPVAILLSPPMLSLIRFFSPDSRFHCR
jgi:hypothetical protein